MFKFKKLLSLFLMLIIAINSNVIAHATVKSQIDIATNGSSVLVTDIGIYINNEYYTQDEFVELLNTAVKVETGSTNTRVEIVAGTWWIPGIGQIVVTVTGAILIGGAVVAVGSWAYNTIVGWFIEMSYDNAKGSGGTTDNHSTTTGSSLPTTGSPNSSKDLIDSDGSTKQRRYYDKNGNADMDIDYHHSGDNSHTFPHRHDWINGVRGPAY